MKKIILGILIILLFIVGCAGVDVSKVSNEDLERIASQVIVCNQPYIRFATGCCLDQNNNTICDNDEATEIIATINETITEEECIELAIKYTIQEPYQATENYIERVPYTTTETYYETEQVKKITDSSTISNILNNLNDYSIDCDDYSDCENKLQNGDIYCESSSLADVSCSGTQYESKQVKKTREVTKYKTVEKTRIITKYKSVEKIKTKEICGEEINDFCSKTSLGDWSCPTCTETALGDWVCPEWCLEMTTGEIRCGAK